MSGSAQFFVKPGHVHQLFAGGGGGGDEPRYPWHLKSAHEVDAVVPRRSKRAARSPPGGGPFLCPICDRPFNTEKAVHGHMRCHPEREWRGMEAPRELCPGELAADGKHRHYSYVSDHCKAPFETRQALGGHRASHNGKKGCSWHSKQQLAMAAEEAVQAVAAAAAAMEAAEAAAGPSNTGGGKQPKHNFDLNDAAPEE